MEKELTPYPYQEEGIRFLTARKYAMLAHEPGLGKTAMAILAAKAVGATQILVICPKSAIPVWHIEFREWWPGGPTPMVVNFDVMSVGGNYPNPQGEAVYAVDHWDLLIVDEAHRLKSPGANRTKNTYGRVAPLADRVWLLTGTPTPNNNSELYTHMRALVPEYIRGSNGKVMTFDQFAETYCEMKTFPGRNWKPRIAGNKPEGTMKLREILKPFVLRRRKREVLADLPPLRFVTQPLEDWDKTQNKLLDSERALPKDVPPDELLQWLRSNEVHISVERRLTGVAKLPGVIQAIEDRWDAGNRKLIVFAHHREVMDVIEKHFTASWKVARIDGATSKADRAKAVVDFQTDPNFIMFLGQISACGEALTLTAASEVIFAEASWTPSDNYQAACRAHRIGQNNAVTARFLTIPGSIDDVIARVLARKAREIAELFG